MPTLFTPVNIGIDNREVITELSNKLEGTFTRKEVTKVVDTLLKIITESISKGEAINLTGFGKFAIKEQPPRRYYNIHTDQIEYSTTKKVVVFTPNKVLYNQLLKN